MVRTVDGRLLATGMRFCVVASRFNDSISERLVSGAIDALVRHGADEEITVIRVPGAFEIPAVAGRAARRGNFDAVICVGAVIRGETPHFDYVAAEVSKGIAALALGPGPAVTFGVITADTLDQAIDRAGGKHGNKGAEAALAAVELVNLFRAMSA